MPRAFSSGALSIWSNATASAPPTGEHLGDGRGEGGLAVVDVADGADVQVLLGAGVHIVVAGGGGPRRGERTTPAGGDPVGAERKKVRGGGEDGAKRTSGASSRRGGEETGMARRARREGSSVETGARRDGRGTNVERGLDAREVRNVASRRGKPTDEKCTQSSGTRCPVRSEDAPAAPGRRRSAPPS